jgi:hypothetical protein
MVKVAILQLLFSCLLSRSDDALSMTGKNPAYIEHTIGPKQIVSGNRFIRDSTIPPLSRFKLQTPLRNARIYDGMEPTQQRIGKEKNESQVPGTFQPVSKLISRFKQLILLRKAVGVTEKLPSRSEADNAPTPQECLAQVDRLVGSPLLYGSEALSKLLRYLAHHTISSPGDHLKEYQIATEVLGRPAEFDPQSDSSVRVQVGRLRAKLAEYYNSTGSHDPILVDVPKGRYSLSFERREAPVEVQAVSKAAAPDPPPAAVPRIRSAGVIGLTVLANALLTSGILIYSFHYKMISPTASRAETPVHASPALQAFWSPFLHSQEDPFVIYSNATFAGDPVSSMHYYDPAHDSRDQVSQYYTGVGEVMGALQLDRLFHQFGRQFRIKRGGLFTLDDALNNNLIFLGSPTEDTPLDRIPNTSEFVIRRLPGEKSRWSSIVNLHPQSGESDVYQSTLRPTSPVSEDYAVIALVSGLSSTHQTLILEGISTLGTQAAVDYVCDEGAMEGLLRQLHVKNGAQPPPFEAVLKIKVANDVPLETHLVALRITQH